MKYQQTLVQKCDGIIMEAKRVLLVEKLDQLANLALSEENSVKNLQTIKTEDKKVLLTTGDSSEELKKNDFKSRSTSANDFKSSAPEHSNILTLRRCFEKWKYFANSKKCISSEQVQTEKLDQFITKLKNHRTKESFSKSAPPQITKHEKPKSGECFANRFKTQKHVIDMQRAKIQEQNKIINELQLGIIREDLLKSIENTKIEIRDIFNNCSESLLSVAPLLQTANEREEMMIRSQKAPKTIRQMQQKAIERIKYREIILERKRLIEEARQKLLEEAIEKKRVLEEEEKRYNLKMIIEQRKKELHLQKIQQEKRLAFERKILIATDFYKNLLKRRSFKMLLNYYVKAKENFTLAVEFNLFKRKDTIFKAWLGYIEAKYKIKYEFADAHYNHKLLSKALGKFKENKFEAVRSMQVAEDLYDFRLTINTFIHWHRYTCKRFLIEQKKMQISIKHHNRRLLFQYFYQWRSLPVVLQLEKTKEEKKRKWREKVWQILPDYHPPEEL